MTTSTLLVKCRGQSVVFKVDSEGGEELHRKRYLILVDKMIVY